MKALHCYYIDEPLTVEERAFVEKTLLGPWARFKSGATQLEERRVPAVLPAPNANGQYDEGPLEHAQLVRANLRRAGIADDRGRQVAWIGPRDVRWSGLIMYAIAEETGFHPYFIKRWFPEGDDFVRDEIQIIDGHGLASGR